MQSNLTLKTSFLQLQTEGDVVKVTTVRDRDIVVDSGLVGLVSVHNQSSCDLLL